MAMYGSPYMANHNFLGECGHVWKPKLIGKWNQSR